MADDDKIKSKPESDIIQFGEHVPKMMKVVGSDLQKGQPIASMQPIPISPIPPTPPTPTQDSTSTSTNGANTNTEKKE